MFPPKFGINVVFEYIYVNFIQYIEINLYLTMF
jgi:hypothetical protein